MQLSAGGAWRHVVAGVVAVVVCPGLAVAADGARRSQPASTALLEEWVEVIEQHVPGTTDPSLVGAAGWSSVDLQQLWGDIQILLDVVAHPGHDRFTVQPLPFALPARERRAAVLNPVERAAFDRLSGRLRRLGGNAAIARAVIVHTDLVTLIPDLVRASAGIASTGAPLRLNIGDGTSAGGESVSLHWEVAQMLLRHVAPDPATDPFVRDWYRATLALSQTVQVFDISHQRRALRLLPDDPVILLLAGCAHEAFASSLFQSFATAWQGRRLQTGIASEGRELDLAAGYFRRALGRDPALTEARVRLGHVLGRQARWADSVKELDLALAERLEPVLEYFALLHLGTAHDALGDPASAVVALRRAATLMPGSRAPHLALARLLHQLGDREGSVASLSAALGGQLDDGPADPWWTYRGVRGQGSAGWLDALRATVGRATP